MHRSPLPLWGWRAILIVSLCVFLFPAVPRVVAGQPEPGYTVYLPIAASSGRSALFLNTQSRSEVVSTYQQVFSASEAPIQWTGSQTACDPGSTSAGFQAAVLRRINYFRAMAGVPADVQFSPDSNRKAQAAAVIMSTNKALTHDPKPDWKCYSDDGAAGAGTSNLFLGLYGRDAITGYMRDPGEGNTAVGHRRWILYPNTLTMGTGDIPGGNGYPATNSLVVFGTSKRAERPQTRDGYVAWPPPGYVPYTIAFPRWSFSYPKADFSDASVTMSLDGSDLPIQQYPVQNGYGENTLAWIRTDMNHSQSWLRPNGDERYIIKVQNVRINGQPVDFSYEVIVIDPAS